MSGTTVYAGGYFTSVGGTTRNRLAAIGTDGTLAGWNPNANSTVSALAMNGTSVVAGGYFSTIGGTTRNRLAAIAADGTLTAWNPNANNTVSALAVSGTTVYAGGNFTSVSGTMRSHLAAVAADGTLTTWDPNTNWNVSSLAVSGTTLYAGGQFTSIGDTTRNHLAAFETSTGALTAWDPKASGEVSALAVSGTTVYAGGAFTTIGGTTPRIRLAAIDATSGTATTWNPNAGGTVNALAVNGPALYAGGYFSTVGGIPRPMLAKFQPSLVTTTTVAATPNPAAYGAAVTLTATLSPTTATGSVTFKDGTTTLGTGTLAGGSATYVTSALTVGSHDITSVYAGDTDYSGSTSAAYTLTIGKADQTISFANPGSQVYGTSPTLSATATSTLAVTFTSTTPTVCTITTGGVLTFTGVDSCTINADQGGDANFNAAPQVTQTFTVAKANPSVTTWPTADTIHYGQTLADSTLSGGTATPAGGFAFTAPGTAPPVGTASQGVTFTPTDTAHYNTAAGTVSVTVDKAGSTALLVADPNPATLGQSVQLTATVTAAGGTGTVTFMDGAATLGNGPLSGGTATLSTSVLTAGSHSLSAVYAGDDNYQGATSPALTQVVQVPVTIATNPAGLTVTVDGTGHPAPYSTAWTPGASHQLAVPQYQGGADGTRAAFGAWSDGGALSHTVTAPSAAATFTAAFATQYQLTTAAAPASAGLIAPATGGWFAAGTTAPVTIYPVVGYAVASWTVNGTTTETAVNTQPVLMSEPMSVTATLAGAQPELTAGVSSARTGTKPIRTWTLTLTNRTTGTGPAPSPRFDSLTLTQTYPAGGPTCTPAVGTLPTLTGPLAVGATLSGTVGIDFTGCTAGARFQATLRYSDGGRAAGLSTLNNQPQ
ncbi:Ig-like domain-containing protein [Candidatus Thiodictyon syntrophicum]|uniref:beta strand repeat-containing protein n=1 Tax=Candidatus Thiodictyon syntrophicum TaxID=1166950 RepID=UPI001561CC64